MATAKIDRTSDPQAYRALSGTEPVFARLITKYGHPAPFEWHDGGHTGDSQFAAMVLHIVGQQISAVAAFRIYERIAAACGEIPTAAAILQLTAKRLQDTGLSAAKMSYVLALAHAQADGTIDVESLSDFNDAEVIAHLTAIRGIGLWSAQTFLIHNLARPDVLPAGDTGIRRAIADQWAMPELPTPHDVTSRGQAWAPYRSYGAALLWRSLTPVGEESDPKARALQRQAAQHPLRNNH
jgi:DNA-3-methyladenine glycosylase II